MFITANFLEAIAVVLDYVLQSYMWIIVVTTLLSWVRVDPYNPIVIFLNMVTQPVFYQVRKRLPVVFGGIDLSPAVVILAIIFLRTFIVNSLYGLARSI